MTTDEDLEPLLETPGPFLEWLGGFTSHSRVGYRGSGADCPIARFLQQSTGDDDLDVDYSDVLYGRDNRFLYPMPEWAHQAAELIDGHGSDGTPVTKRHVLGVLRREGIDTESARFSRRRRA